MGTPAEAVQRVFVASYGSDANAATNCNFANPCRGFTAAMTVVDPGGEVIALDAAGYGAVTITKSVAIIANPGFYAGVSASTGNAVTIATAGISVTLRGLSINGLGGSYGVHMTNGAKLSIENCIISNFVGDGVFVNTAAKVRIVDSLIRDNLINGAYFQNGATATVSGTKFLGNGNTGTYVSGSIPSTTTTLAISESIFTNPNVAVYALADAATAVARVSVIRSTLANNAYGPTADEGLGSTVMTISDSMVTGNTVYGFYQAGSAVLKSLGNNTSDFNGPDYGTVTFASTF
jgi:hypothetical protein